MDFKEPVVVYTAASNLEAHSLAEALISSGIDAYAVEDQSGASLWALGTISQFHQPNVFVDKPDVHRAAELIAGYESQRKRREEANPEDGEASALCESCGKISTFPAALNGTTQQCPYCRGYVDVGEGFDEPEPL